MSFSKIFLLLLLVLLSSKAFCGWIHDAEVVDVRWYSNYGYITVDDTDNSACEGASPTPHKRILESNPGHEKIVSMALAALMGEKRVTLLISGCHAEQYPIVTGITVKK